MSKTKSGRHRLSKTDKRLLAALIAAGYEERKARASLKKPLYKLKHAHTPNPHKEHNDDQGRAAAHKT
ncbi:hypothetical protein HmCmsJML015_02268 [Escherichia coli]|uniref:hypothetical protein n=1 Tax=Escherichia coli TaxID=562 RepID=UPI0010C30903|nr:hypothetical protein [Escherichia coli]GCS45881.1 hypothetical protein HmCmsJML015_02268 [Escherichia coli]